MLTRAVLEQLDRDDPLAPFRERFALPPGVVYLDGNSLGPLPRVTPGRIAEVIAREWGEGLIRSWNDAGWINLAARVADGLARLVGAPPGSVAVADSTSVNLFKLLGAALTLRPGRRVIVSERDNFPTGLYVAQGVAAFLGGEHTVRLVEPGAAIDAAGDDTAAVMLSHVNYRTGALHDMAAVTRAAQERGALVLWDLAHSAGAMPVDLSAADADFAVGCGYKFLNGGPGAPAFLYVAPRLHAALRLPITGWLGHAPLLAFEAEYRPAWPRRSSARRRSSASRRWRSGAAWLLEASLYDVRAKSLRQVALLAALIEQAAPGAFRQVTPDDPARPGLTHEIAQVVQPDLASLSWLRKRGLSCGASCWPCTPRGR